MGKEQSSSSAHTHDNLEDALVGGGREPAAKKGNAAHLVVCVLCGVLMGSWAPLSASSMPGSAMSADESTAVGKLTPYSSFFLFTCSVLATSPAIVLVLCRCPPVGQPCDISEYCSTLTASQHLRGMLAGGVWGVGTLLNLLVGSQVGSAVSYAIGQAAPLVAAVWGIFLFAEFKGAPVQAHIFLGLMFVLYLGAIL